MYDIFAKWLIMNRPKEAIIAPPLLDLQVELTYTPSLSIWTAEGFLLTNSF